MTVLLIRETPFKHGPQQHQGDSNKCHQQLNSIDNTAEPTDTLGDPTTSDQHVSRSTSFSSAISNSSSASNIFDQLAGVGDTANRTPQLLAPIHSTKSRKSPNPTQQTTHKPTSKSGEKETSNNQMDMHKIARLAVDKDDSKTAEEMKWQRDAKKAAESLPFMSRTIAMHHTMQYDPEGNNHGYRGQFYSKKGLISITTSLSANALSISLDKLMLYNGIGRAEYTELDNIINYWQTFSLAEETRVDNFIKQMHEAAEHIEKMFFSCLASSYLLSCASLIKNFNKMYSDVSRVRPTPGDQFTEYAKQMVKQLVDIRTMVECTTLAINERYGNPPQFALLTLLKNDSNKSTNQNPGGVEEEKAREEDTTAADDDDGQQMPEEEKDESHKPDGLGDTLGFKAPQSNYLIKTQTDHQTKIKPSINGNGEDVTNFYDGLRHLFSDSKRNRKKNLHKPGGPDTSMPNASQSGPLKTTGTQTHFYNETQSTQTTIEDDGDTENLNFLFSSPSLRRTKQGAPQALTLAKKSDGLIVWTEAQDLNLNQTSAAKAVGNLSSDKNVGDFTEYLQELAERINTETKVDKNGKITDVFPATLGYLKDHTLSFFPDKLTAEQILLLEYLVGKISEDPRLNPIIRQHAPILDAVLKDLKQKPVILDEQSLSAEEQRIVKKIRLQPLPYWFELFALWTHTEQGEYRNTSTDKEKPHYTWTLLPIDSGNHQNNEEPGYITEENKGKLREWPKIYNEILKRLGKSYAYPSVKKKPESDIEMNEYLKKLSDGTINTEQYYTVQWERVKFDQLGQETRVYLRLISENLSKQERTLTLVKETNLEFYSYLSRVLEESKVEPTQFDPDFVPPYLKKGTTILNDDERIQAWDGKQMGSNTKQQLKARAIMLHLVRLWDDQFLDKVDLKR